MMPAGCRSSRSCRRLAASAAVVALLLAPPALGPAADFVVDSTDDAGMGTLRQAILDANAAPNGPEPDRIVFAFEGEGPFTIAPLSDLPGITDPVVIDGYTQAGTAANSSAAGAPLNGVILVEIAGPADASIGAGLVLSAGGSTVRGLCIHGFDSDGQIRLTGAGGNRIDGCYIGTNPAGTSAGAAGGASGPGIVVAGNSDANVIGGSAAAARNLIGGSGGDGILLLAMGANAPNDTTIAGNWIGLAASGMAAIPNAGAGVLVDRAAANRLGTNSTGGGNAICGNGGDGVRIEGAAATGNTIFNNLIGESPVGARPLGNGDDGVDLAGGASQTMVGGVLVRQANRIAHNADDGVAIPDATPTPTRNSIRQNFTYGNGGQGIDLGGDAVNGDGVTANDTLDPDGGPNTLINYPEVVGIILQGPMVIQVNATYRGAPNLILEFEFYASKVCDGSGSGEGEVYVGQAISFTDENGEVGIQLFLSQPLDPCHSFTITTIDEMGNTSEFGPCGSENPPCMEPPVLARHGWEVY